MRRLMSAIAIAAMFTTGCGKSEEQKQAEQAAADLNKAAEALGQAAGQAGAAGAAAGLGEATKAMQSMANALSGAGGDGKPVEPVAFQTLQTYLPTVSGWKMDEPEGQRLTMPVPFSQVETNYQNGEARIEATIVDTGFAQLLIEPWQMMLATGYSRKTGSGYEKATTIHGNPAIEKWDSNSKNGEIDVLVGKRFMVTLQGHDLGGIRQLQDFASNFDFGAIAAAK
jgi:hypothetical protein